VCVLAAAADLPADAADLLADVDRYDQPWQQTTDPHLTDDIAWVRTLPHVVRHHGQPAPPDGLAERYCAVLERLARQPMIMNFPPTRIAPAAAVP
jgi:hypothetical protein